MTPHILSLLNVFQTFMQGIFTIPILGSLTLSTLFYFALFAVAIYLAIRGLRS